MVVSFDYHPRKEEKKMKIKNVFRIGSGLSDLWIKNTHIPYVTECEKQGVIPFPPDKHYKLSLKDSVMNNMSDDEKVNFTRREEV